MSPENTLQLLLALLGFAVIAAAFGWSRHGRGIWAPVATLTLAAAATLAAVGEDLSPGRTATTLLVVLSGALAVIGGGPVTTRIFAIIDGAEQRDHSTDLESAQTLAQAGQVLRGGAWIGVLERLAVFSGLVTGFPEGVAVVLALKSVGRFPDLRSDAPVHGAASERFIIGTFASMLWAAGCAGIAALVR